MCTFYEHPLYAVHQIICKDTEQHSTVPGIELGGNPFVTPFQDDEEALVSILWV